MVDIVLIASIHTTANAAVVTVEKTARMVIIFHGTVNMCKATYCQITISYIFHILWSLLAVY